MDQSQIKQKIKEIFLVQLIRVIHTHNQLLQFLLKFIIDVAAWLAECVYGFVPVPLGCYTWED